MEILNTQLATGIELKEVNESERSIVHYISTKNVDSYKEILIPKGMDDSKFKAVLWSHERGGGSMLNPAPTPKPSELIIGKSLWRKPDDVGVLAKTQFAETPLGEDVYQFNKQGYINSWSVGWRPKGKQEFDDESKITTFNEWYLYEYSAVIFPANNESVNLSAEEFDVMYKSAQSEEVKNYFDVKKFKDTIYNLSEYHIKSEDYLKQLSEKLDSQNEIITKLQNEIKEIITEKKNIVETVSKQRLSKSELETVMKSAVAGAVSSITGKKIK